VDVKGLIDLEKGIEFQRGRVEEARRNVVSLRGKVEGMDIEIKSLDAKLSVSTGLPTEVCSSDNSNSTDSSDTRKRR